MNSEKSEVLPVDQGVGQDLASRRAPSGLSPNVVVLGIVSLLMGMSSAMIYGVLPVFLVSVIGASMASVGVIEGIAEATTSFMKILSGYASDRLGRRKPLVVIGYALSAVNKLVFPMAEGATTVLIARVADRLGKGIRDAPRDALLTDITPSHVRGAGFGLRLALYTIGAVVGPLSAIALMKISGDNFRLVFWLALIPGFASILVLMIGLEEPSGQAGDGAVRPALCWRDFALLPAEFWWAILLTAILALARFSPAFLVLKTHEVGVDAALVPAVMVVMYVIYSASAYPFGLLVDRTDRHVQLAAGIAVLTGADLVLAFASTIWMTLLGAALWGLQMGITQGLLTTVIGDSAPAQLRGSAFGLFDVAIGIATFAASAGAGMLWMLGGPAAAFSTGASFAGLSLVFLMFRPAIVARKR
ncbi:MAG: MFS transporter [Bradyrhizobium sp.]